MNVSIIGTGYVGLVTAVALAYAGHRVVCVGRNRDKVTSINAGKALFFEPGLDNLLNRVIAKRRFTASVEFSQSVVRSDVTIIAVGTPTVDGAIDLTQVREAARLVGEALSKKRSYHVVAVKSTVVPGTTESIVWPILANASGKSVKLLGLCMNPEFLREGNAVEDALHPDRIVIGSSDKKSARAYAKLFFKNRCPVFYTNLATAEMSKYVANTLLATLVSFS
ncbi:UDP-glucose/GDP-mannose dehydrogenase family protein, partial [Candidatus Gottesmanbacteria bacterium]|nr:UDP-glucose/GDP-mannose dehydrogenase family protein [Candidatus Gottesmanbacteria bacterium]